MKKLLLAAIASILFAGAASAADMAPRYTKAPPPVAAVVYNWTGFYIGADVGGYWERNSGTTNWFSANSPANLTNNPLTASFDRSGVIGSVHGGYNWQAGQWVLGVEADFSWLGNGRTSFCRQTDVLGLACADNGRGFLTFTDRADWIVTARGRVGYAWNQFMLYGTGGVAWGHVNTTINANCLVNGCGFSTITLNTTQSFDQTKVGWAAGVGGEYMFTPNWILRAEYLHVDLGSVDTTLNLIGNAVPGSPQSATWSRNYRYDIGRVGLSYKFGGPVVAKY